MSLKRKTIVATVLILLIPFSLADDELDSEIATSCDVNYEPVVSMADPTAEYSNPGPPEMYDNKVCVRGINESKFSTSCEVATGFYMSSKNRTAHFSEQNSYYWNVCTGRMSTRISSGPAVGNETALFSVSDKHNGHIAEPDFYNYNVYGRYRPPRNVTLEFEFNLSSSDTVYFDEEEVDGEQSFSPPAAFPYLISKSDPYISGLVTRSFSEAERSFSNSKNRLSITRTGTGDFILPFTRGDLDDVEDNEDNILIGTFLNSVSPNFGFARIDKPDVKARLSRAEIFSEISVSSGFHEINVTKTGENEVTIKEVG